MQQLHTSQHRKHLQGSSFANKTTRYYRARSGQQYHGHGHPKWSRCWPSGCFTSKRNKSDKSDRTRVASIVTQLHTIELVIRVRLLSLQLVDGWAHKSNEILVVSKWNFKLSVVNVLKPPCRSCRAKQVSSARKFFGKGPGPAGFPSSIHSSWHSYRLLPPFEMHPGRFQSRSTGSTRITSPEKLWRRLKKCREWEVFEGPVHKNNAQVYS